MKNLTITSGQFLRNGGNRLFLIKSMDAKSVILEEYTANGGTERFVKFSYEIFVKLWKNKNWTEIKFNQNEVTGKWSEKTDRGISRQIGSERFLVKQF